MVTSIPIRCFSQIISGNSCNIFFAYSIAVWLFRIVLLKQYGCQSSIVKVHAMQCLMNIPTVIFPSNTHVSARFATSSNFHQLKLEWFRLKAVLISESLTAYNYVNVYEKLNNDKYKNCLSLLHILLLKLQKFDPCLLHLKIQSK